MTATVLEIWRYPVKSVGGETLDETTVTELGVEGDRSWGIRDLDSGFVLTARREPRLLMATAAWSPAGPTITTIEGDTLTTSADVSGWLGRSVELLPASDVGGSYENPLTLDDATGAESDWIDWQGPGWANHDNPDMRVSLVSTTSLGEWDRRRFRINLVVGGDAEPDWDGRQLSIGTVALRTTRRIDRCVMVNRPQPDIDADTTVLTTIRRTTGTLGIGAIVVAPGTIRVGDEVTLPS